MSPFSLPPTTTSAVAILPVFGKAFWALSELLPSSLGLVFRLFPGLYVSPELKTGPVLRSGLIKSEQKYYWVARCNGHHGDVSEERPFGGDGL